MELLVIICNQPERINKLMEFLLDQGVPGATVLHSEGMGRLISQDAPLLARFGHKLSSVKPRNRTVLSVVESPQKAQSILSRLSADPELGLEKHGVAFSVPLSGCVGLRGF